MIFMISINGKLLEPVSLFLCPGLTINEYRLNKLLSFRSLDGKLQIVEGVAFDIKTTLGEGNETFTFNDVRLNKNKLLQAKIKIGDNEDLFHALELLNDASAFRRYQESRKR